MDALELVVGALILMFGLVNGFVFALVLVAKKEEYDG